MRTSGLMQRAVPVQEVPMLEVGTPPELDLALARVLNDGLTGFVICAAGFEGVLMDTHDLRLGIVNEALNRVAIDESGKSRPYEVAYRIEGITSRDALRGGRSSLKGIGRIHDDQVPGFEEGINVHTTTHGNGKVILANSGPERGNYRKSLSLLHAEYADMAKLLLEGLVDPGQMLPEMQTTILHEGDTLVFALNNSNGPVLHRFGTSSKFRDANVAYLKPADLKV